jgi:hypothetical protein
MKIKICIVDLDRIDGTEILRSTTSRYNEVFKATKILPAINDKIYVYERGTYYKVIERNFDDPMLGFKNFLDEEFAGEDLVIDILVRDDNALVDKAAALRDSLNYQVLNQLEYFYEGDFKIFALDKDNKIISLDQMLEVRRYYNAKVEYFNTYREYHGTLPDYCADEWDCIDDYMGELLNAIKKKQKKTFKFENMYEKSLFYLNKGSLTSYDDYVK